nr:toxin-antitoxin system HicB family antitoxin [Cellulosimicrobium arenosum]
MPDDAPAASSGSGVPAGQGDEPDGPPPRRAQRKSVLLRLDPAVHDALARWAADDLRSVNAQMELLLRRALADAHRLPRDVRPPRRPGRPPRAG